MGSIFGISDLPVGTIYTATRINGGIELPKPEYRDLKQGNDSFLSQAHTKSSNLAIKQKNKFGKILSLFNRMLKK